MDVYGLVERHAKHDEKEAKAKLISIFFGLNTLYNGELSSNPIRRLRIPAVDEGWDGFKGEEIAGRNGYPVIGFYNPEIRTRRDVEPFDTKAFKIAFALCLEKRVAAKRLEVRDARNLRDPGAWFQGTGEKGKLIEHVTMPVASDQALS